MSTFMEMEINLYQYALCWWLNLHHPEGQVARWTETLQQYDQVEHRPGSRHGNADALSRQQCSQDTCNHCDGLDVADQAKMSGEQVLM